MAQTVQSKGVVIISPTSNMGILFELSMRFPIVKDAKESG